MRSLFVCCLHCAFAHILLEGAYKAVSCQDAVRLHQKNQSSFYLTVMKFLTDGDKLCFSPLNQSLAPQPNGRIHARSAPNSTIPTATGCAFKSRSQLLLRLYTHAILKLLKQSLSSQPKGTIHAARAPNSTNSLPQTVHPRVDPVYHSMILPATLACNMASGFLAPYSC